MASERSIPALAINGEPVGMEFHYHIVVVHPGNPGSPGTSTEQIWCAMSEEPRTVIEWDNKLVLTGEMEVVKSHLLYCGACSASLRSSRCTACGQTYDTTKVESFPGTLALPLPPKLIERLKQKPTRSRRFVNGGDQDCPSCARKVNKVGNEVKGNEVRIYCGHEVNEYVKVAGSGLAWRN